MTDLRLKLNTNLERGRHCRVVVVLQPLKPGENGVLVVKQSDKRRWRAGTWINADRDNKTLHHPANNPYPTLSLSSTGRSGQKMIMNDAI